MSRRTGWRIGAALAAAIAAPAVGGGEIVPDGDPIPLPESASGGGRIPIVAALGGGEFLVGWSTDPLAARRFSAAREPLGEVMVLTEDAGSCGDLAADEAGGFWAVWCEFPGGMYSRVRLRRFSSEGAPLTPVLTFGESADQASVRPHLATRTGGGVLVLRTEVDLSDVDGPWLITVYAQAFDALGVPATGPQGVNGGPVALSHDTSVARLPAGGYVAAWSGLVRNVDGTFEIPVRARRLDGQGVPMGPPITVNEEEASQLSWPKVAALGDSGFVVAWSGSEAKYRTFDGEGRPTSPERAVGDGCTRIEFATSLDEHAILGCSADGFELRAARLGQDGLGASAFLATTHAYRAGAAGVMQGRFVAAWLLDGEVGAGGFKLPAIFADGFETGSTAAWSETVP